MQRPGWRPRIGDGTGSGTQGWYRSLPPVAWLVAVPGAGLEPACLSAAHFECAVSADSTNPASRDGGSRHAPSLAPAPPQPRGARSPLRAPSGSAPGPVTSLIIRQAFDGPDARSLGLALARCRGGCRGGVSVEIPQALGRGKPASWTRQARRRSSQASHSAGRGTASRAAGVCRRRSVGRDHLVCAVAIVGQVPCPAGCLDRSGRGPFAEADSTRRTGRAPSARCWAPTAPRSLLPSRRATRTFLIRK